MSWSPQLVALDVDGTVVDRDGKLPDPVRDAVAELLDRGVLVVLATGRSWHGTEEIFDGLQLPAGPAICSNGAVIVSYPPVEVLRTVTFDATEAVTKVLQRQPDTLVAVEEVGRGYRVSGPFPDGDLTGELITTDVAEMIAQPVTRVILRDPNSTDEDFVRLAAELGLHGCSYFIGWSAWLDIVPEGVNKATALAEVAERYGIDRADVLALGDGRNDLEMLRWAGRGVALGEAPDVVKAVADHVTDGFDDGGTVTELRRWLH
ncbi:HAD family hydrolase [Microlunatus soli]|uniref:HAD-superfamily hydrolase, subfamily IIB n=1 Tax=Microlunatus soli TaxID=630515 RepID=A0A1H1TIB3_9ACTN|nr:HAD family hydrolase [Microlunatus soli]SDS59940.1 HAD-superfamily hydrolase, subfamily IIB [Microlunatus soli]